MIEEVATKAELKAEKDKIVKLQTYDFPKLRWMSSSRIRVEFRGSCLKQDDVSFNPRNAVNFMNNIDGHKI